MLRISREKLSTPEMRANFRVAAVERGVRLGERLKSSRTTAALCFPHTPDAAR
jgi:hypothetical protein